MAEDKKKQKQQVTKVCIVAGALTGVGVFVGYQIGHKKALNKAHKHWVDLAHRIVENGETLGLMVPEENGICTYLDLKPASEDYEGMVRGFLNIYTI